jgi:hypothetical protein
LPHLVTHINHATDYDYADEQDKDECDADELGQNRALSRLADAVDGSWYRKRRAWSLRPLLTGA